MPRVRILHRLPARSLKLLPLCGLLLGLCVAVVPGQAPVYTEKENLLVYRDASGEHPVKTTAEWSLRREHILAGMQRVMGPLPGELEKVPLDPRYTQEVETPHYLRKQLTFAVLWGERVPAFL